MRELENYKNKKSPFHLLPFWGGWEGAFLFRVPSRTRTDDIQNHNLTL